MHSQTHALISAQVTLLVKESGLRVGVDDARPYRICNHDLAQYATAFLMHLTPRVAQNQTVRLCPHSGAKMFQLLPTELRVTFVNTPAVLNVADSGLYYFRRHHLDLLAKTGEIVEFPATQLTLSTQEPVPRHWHGSGMNIAWHQALPLYGQLILLVVSI